MPTAVPLAALLPSIVSFAEQDAAAPQGWALEPSRRRPARPGGGADRRGIREGELLLLHPARDRVGEPLYDDVVEVLGEGAAESGWSPRETRAAAAVLGVLAVLGAVWAGVTVGTPLAGVLLGVLAAAARRGAALSHAAGDVPAGTVLGALAALTGAAFGVVLLGPPFGAAHVAVAAAVAVLVAATGPALVDGGDAVFVGLGLTALLALLGGALVLLAGLRRPAPRLRVVAPLALALTTAAPTVALRLSRIPRPPLPRTAADLAEVPGQLELDRVLDRVRRARALLSGLVAGCYAAAALVVAVLTRTPRPSGPPCSRPS